MTPHPSPLNPAAPPEPAFTRCHCGALVLTRVFVFTTTGTPAHWRELPAPMDPVGLENIPHRCAEAPPAGQGAQP